MSSISVLLAPLVIALRITLTPLSFAPFTTLGLSISAFDIVAALRLCVVLRQLREIYLHRHLKEANVKKVESRSFVRDVTTTWVVVYGGEAVAAPFLGFTPSFVISPIFPILYAAIQAIVEYLPASIFPTLSIRTELPLAFLDGCTRAVLLCTLIPPAVVRNASSTVADSPWTLLLTSFIIANLGFLFTNALSLLHPYSITLQTPPELLPYGWATTDLWCAPLITGLYALLTHAQPFWVEAHVFLNGLLHGGVAGVEREKGGVEAVDPETARAFCAILLAALFVTRTVKSFGGEVWGGSPKSSAVNLKKKVNKSVKTKTQ